jgi:hypothetical protein
MLRTLYACLLLLHPPAFRRRFSPEMLSIFDEAASWPGALPLFIDALASLARQWILRSGSWKLAVAMVCACLQIVAGGLIWIALAHGRPSDRDFSGLDNLIWFILASVGAIVVMVTAVSLWATGFLQERARSPRAAR